MQDLNGLRPWATPRQLEYIDAIESAGGYRAAAKQLGVGHSGISESMKRLRRRAAKQGFAPEHDMTKTAPDSHVVKGVSTLYDADGNVKLQWSKTNLKKEAEAEALHEAAKELSQSLPRYEPKPCTLELTSNQLSAYVIGDAHVGALVQNTQNLNQGRWDLKTAEEATIGALDHLINISGGTDVGMLVDVGDFAHADNAANISQSGHFHKTDGDFKDVVKACIRIYRTAIELMLDKHREVVIMIVRGNHNANVALHMATMLEAVYENEPRVTIMDNRHKFMQYEYGSNFFGAHHGDKMRVQQAYEFFTRVFAESWGRTQHRHCFMGHIHHQSAKEIGGMVFETYNTLASPDEWHSHSGYGAKRSMSAIVFDKDHGEIKRHKVGISQVA